MPGTASGDPKLVLATDLDGTFIPLDGNRQQIADLREIARELKRNRVTLIFVTGRHFDSVLQAVQQFSLPFPDWIICDVGSSIYTRRTHGGYQLVEAYHEHQDEIIASLPIEELQHSVAKIDGLRLQEAEKQGPYKLSFYANAEQLTELTAKVRAVIDQAGAPYSIIHSVDPFNGDGLIDLLPTDVSKAYALDWWTEHAHRKREQIVFSGDSGNDYAALTAGYRTILVGNADRQLAQRVFQQHRAQHWHDRVFLAKGHATSGVLEGMRWFGLAEGPMQSAHHDQSDQNGLGANCISYKATSFKVWAPRHSQVEVELIRENGVSHHKLAAHGEGYFSCSPRAGPGRYQVPLRARRKQCTPRPGLQIPTGRRTRSVHDCEPPSISVDR